MKLGFIISVIAVLATIVWKSRVDGQIANDTRCETTAPFNFPWLKEYFNLSGEMMDCAWDMTQQSLNMTRPIRTVAGPAQIFSTGQYITTLSQTGMTLLNVIKQIGTRFSLSNQRVVDELQKNNLTNVLSPLQAVFSPDAGQLTSPYSGDFCPYRASMFCDVQLPFRSFDGSCNNIRKPIIGRAITPYSRLLPAKYDDGVETIRSSVSGAPLPEARTISVSLFTDEDNPHPRSSMALVFFGQFIDHDLASTQATEIPDKSVFGDTMAVDCGSNTACRTGKGALEACLPIMLNASDPDFKSPQKCLLFTRSMAVPHLNCAVGAREQLNLNTHWLDASHVYGGSKERADNLRDKDTKIGKMLIAPGPLLQGRQRKPFLPSTTAAAGQCVSEIPSCFNAGDARVNENIGLGTYHTLFIRYHNELEEMLFTLNPRWSGERLYQESRKIVTAVLQQITYNEFLPLVLGPAAMKTNQLELVMPTYGYYYGYDETIDARIPNSFAGAAYRFGHSLIQTKMYRIVDSINPYGMNDSLMLSETFGNTSGMNTSESNDGIDSVIRGMAAQPCQTCDLFFTKQISRSLFADNPPHGLGLDLTSLNIQRGRDHGLPTYNDFREYCGLTRARTFEELSREVTGAGQIQKLKQVYADVNDIDLFAGGLAETPMAGALVGPTFGGIIGKSFLNLRKGDRFWYENGNVPQWNPVYRDNIGKAGFSTAQLDEIRKMTMASIFCMTSDSLEEIQPFVFLQPNALLENNRDRNVPVSCASIAKINLRAWKE